MIGNGKMEGNRWRERTTIMHWRQYGARRRARAGRRCGKQNVSGVLHPPASIPARGDSQNRRPVRQPGQRDFGDNWGQNSFGCLRIGEGLGQNTQSQ